MLKKYIDRIELWDALDNVDEPTFDVAVELVELAEPSPVVPIERIKQLREEILGHCEVDADTGEIVACLIHPQEVMDIINNMLKEYE